MAACGSERSYPIRRSAVMGSKSEGTVSCRLSYQSPKPCEASVFQGKWALGSCFRVGAMTPCQRKLKEGGGNLRSRETTDTRRQVISRGEKDSYQCLPNWRRRKNE